MTGSNTLWQDVLSKATSKAKEQSANLFLLGDTNSGKQTLLSKFSNHVSNASSKTQSIGLDYSYISMSVNTNDLQETACNLNIWQVSNTNHSTLISSLLETHGFNKSVFMITIDLSDPAAAWENTCKWLEVIEQIKEQQFRSMSVAEQQACLQAVSRHIQCYGTSNAAHGEDDASTSGTGKIPGVVVDSTVPERNLGAPVLVVGTKADYFRRTFKSVDKAAEKYDFISRRLRRLCVQYGASMHFTSGVMEAGSTGCFSGGIEALNKYVLYRSPLGRALVDAAAPSAQEPGGPLKAKVLGSCEEQDFLLHVPAGFDSIDLIESLPMANPAWTEETEFKSVFPSTSNGTDTASASNINVPDNLIFFKTLKFQLEKESAGVGSPAPFSSSMSSTLNASSSLASPLSHSAATAASTTASSDPSLATPDSKAGGASGGDSVTGSAPAKQIAVQDFFKSLLVSNSSTKGAKGTTASNQKQVRESAAKALSGMNAEESAAKAKPKTKTKLNL